MKVLVLDLNHEEYRILDNMSNEEFEQLLDDEQVSIQQVYDYITVWSNGLIDIAASNNDDTSETALQLAIGHMFKRTYGEEHEIDWDILERDHAREEYFVEGF